MSHKATNWAISQRGLKPASKLILWHLSDCHNSHTGRCDPSQDRLAYDCEVSRSTLNLHLTDLENRGMIQRQRRYDKAKKTQETTFYILGFDLPETQNEVYPMSENRTRKAVSEKPSKPCPKKAESRVLKSDTNPVREPVIEPCAETRNKIGFDEFWKIYPRARNQLRSAELFKAAVSDGTPPEWIIRSAKSYAIENRENEKKYIAYSDNWLDGERWKDFASKPEQTEKPDPAVFWAKSIKDGRYLSVMAITDNLIREMLDRELLTKQDLENRGVLI